MPLTKEERHALATRIRLGEAVDNSIYGEPPMHWVLPLGTGKVAALGTYLFKYKVAGWVWEDGTKSRVPENYGEDHAWTQAALAYLEKD